MVKIVKNPGNGRLNNLNDLVLDVLKFSNREHVSEYFSSIKQASGLLCCWYKDSDITYRNCYYLWLIQERKVLDLWHVAY